jgi:hypothetical protein
MNHRRWTMFYSTYSDRTMVRLDVSKQALPMPKGAQAPEQQIIDFAERYAAEQIKEAEQMVADNIEPQVVVSFEIDGAIA